MRNTVTSSDPDTVAVEQVLTFWVAVAKAEGSAEITASSRAGERGSVMLTVGAATPASPLTPATPADPMSHLESIIVSKCPGELIQLLTARWAASSVPVNTVRLSPKP